MSLTTEHIRAIGSVVRAAIAAGEADAVTKKSVVKALQERLQLAPDYFDKAQRAAVADHAKQILDEQDANVAAHPSGSRSSPVRSSPPPSSPPVSKIKQRKRPVVQDSEDDAEEEQSPPTKKKAQKAGTSNVKKTTSEDLPKKSKKRKSEGSFRSAEFINSEGDPITASQAGVVNGAASEDEEDKPAKKQKKTAKPSSEKPAKGTKAKSTEVKAEKRQPASNANDPDADELRKLKNFMTACNERKVWGTEFKKLGLDTTKAQVRYLRDRLKELGMPARLSMEAAKKIGARRALEKEARELGIDLDKASKGTASDDDAKPAADVPRPRRAAAARAPPRRQPLRIDSDDSDSDDGANAGAAASKSEESSAGSGQDEETGSESGSGSESSSSSAHSDDSDA